MDSLSFEAAFRAFVRTITAESRLRLAPTPSGYLHAGNALNFILNWLAARYQPGAKLLLRIDDLDADRKRPEYVQDIFDTLLWLGIDWDEGPRNTADFEKNWSQTHRTASYFDALEKLKASDLLFACAKSRRDLEPFGGRYPAAFRNQNLSLDQPGVAWRIRTPDGFPVPDFIVRRRDGIPAYQLASLVDDVHFGVSHVIRGEDLADSTLAQRFLARQLGWREFEQIQFLHHPLLRDSGGEKLSKSAGASSLRGWRETNRMPAELFSTVAQMLNQGISHSFPAINDLLQAFKKSV